MTEILRNLTDDQTALLGCLGALAASMLLLSLSFHTRTGQSKPSNLPISEERSQRSQQQSKRAA